MKKIRMRMGSMLWRRAMFIVYRDDIDDGESEGDEELEEERC